MNELLPEFFGRLKKFSNFSSTNHERSVQENKHMKTLTKFIIAAFAVAAPVAANAIVTAAAASFVAILLGQRIFESIIVSRPWSSRTLLEVWMKFTRLSF